MKHDINNFKELIADTKLNLKLGCYDRQIVGTLVLIVLVSTYYFVK